MTDDEPEDYEDDYDDCEVEDIDCGTEIIDWWSYAADNYRFTADAADARSAIEPRWVVAHCWQRGDEYAYEPITDEITLAEAQEYEAAEGSDDELGVLIAQAESTDDYQERERLIVSLGPLIRAQIARA